MPIDYKKYPKNWKTEIRPRIIKRSDGKCEFCQLKHYQIIFTFKAWIKNEGKYTFKSIWFSSENDAIREHKAVSISSEIKKVKVVLTIAHLDHDELNHDVKDDRLVALCQICHLRYDAKEKYNRIHSKNK